MLKKVGVPLIAMVVFLAIWEALVWVNGWPNYVMASPSDLPDAYIRFWSLFVEGSWQTLWRTVDSRPRSIALSDRKLRSSNPSPNLTFCLCLLTNCRC